MEQQLLNGIIMYVCLLFALVVHESAHAVAANYYGDPTARDLGRISLNPLVHADPIGTVALPLMAILGPALGWGMIPVIGWAKPVPVNSANLRNPIVHNAYIAAAGAASNMLLALAGTILLTIVLFIYKSVPGLLENGGNSFIFFRTFLQSFILINCILAAFNMIPLPPLDGHWILMRYLPHRYVSLLAVIRPYGFFILLALLWTGVLGAFLGIALRLLYSPLLWIAYRMAGIG